MQPDHNTLEMDGTLLSAFIDPQYTLIDVFQYWRQITPALPYLGTNALSFDSQTWDEHQMIATIKDHTEPGLNEGSIRRSGDAECLDGYFGLPLFPMDGSGAKQTVSTFMLPDLRKEDESLSLTWTPAVPVVLSCTRNIIYEKPYFIISININPGTWGCRHLQYRAIEDVFHLLNSMEGAGHEERGIADEAGNLAERISAWETGRIDFEKTRQLLWFAVMQLVEKFSAGKLSILQRINATNVPVDLTVSRLGPSRPELPVYKQDVFYNSTWIECLYWDSPVLNRAISYWAGKKGSSQWDTFYNTCLRYKGCWPTVVKILQQPPVSEMDMERIISFLADLNWPGADEAWAYLISLGPEALKYLDEGIQRARKHQDEDWAEHLQSIRDSLTDET